jgi:sulfate/thiosulfate-binding protein
MQTKKWTKKLGIAVLSALVAGLALSSTARANQTLLNVSYDPTRELYQEYNQAFAKYWQGKTHQSVSIQQSHGGSGKQARAVIDGLGADVVTLGIASDIDVIQGHGLIAPGWSKRLPNHSVPYTSTIVFLVRRGNPKHIRDWADLARPSIAVITPNPKSSSGGRWAYLAAYGHALRVSRGNQGAAQVYVRALYKNVPILDTGARAATVTFTQHHVGDVLLAWENEADLIATQLGRGQYDIVRPSESILAEPPVSIVDKNVDAHHTRAVATAYLQWLYSPVGQEIAARHFYRPLNAGVVRRYAAQFPPIKLFRVETTFGGWDAVQKTHFADGGVFDQIYARR